MTIIKSFKLILFILFLPNIVGAQKNGVDQTILRANELGKKGARLTYEGKHTEALDTFKLYLDYRKKFMAMQIII